MENKEKNKTEQLADKLFYKKKTVFEAYDADTLACAKQYAEGYKTYLNNAKTEREATAYTVSMLEENGYVPYSFGDKIEVGGKYYYNNRGKNVYAFRMGRKSVAEGIRILAAHIDSPRLDLRQHPLIEDTGLGYLKTQYYGGIRKYQWTTVPLALHGTVSLANGDTINVNIGEAEGDPVFCVTDLLPHLARRQSSEPLEKAVPGEKLNIVVASSPYFDDGKPADVAEAVKLNVLSLLFEKYGMTESDFMSAELCAVPAGKCVDIGLDRWLIGGYGHDDIVCAYPEITALIDTENSDNTVMCVLADKEETGSDGTTGMQSYLLCDLIDEISLSQGCDPRAVRAASACLSADVTAAFDPNFADVFEKNNASLVGCGVAMAKYTGARGKSSTNDASAEYVGCVRRMFDEDGVLWQTSEMGKVDEGGGGTVAKYISKLNIDVVDVGVPVLSMHAPFEIISKGDLYSAYLAFKAFCLK